LSRLAAMDGGRLGDVMSGCNDGRSVERLEDNGAIRGSKSNNSVEIFSEERGLDDADLCVLQKELHAYIKLRLISAIYHLFCCILFIKTMRIPNQRLSSFLFLMIILAVSQLSSCRHLHINLGDQTKKAAAETEVSPQFSLHFPAQAPEGSSKDEKDDPVYGVSFRTVPGGPNPLHN
ncbi:unnamed protein product, partial [Dovyalis caffra]